MSKTQNTAVRLGALLLSILLAISLCTSWAEVYADSLEDEPTPAETVTDEEETPAPAEEQDETPAPAEDGEAAEEAEAAEEPAAAVEETEAVQPEEEAAAEATAVPTSEEAAVEPAENETVAAPLQAPAAPQRIAPADGATITNTYTSGGVISELYSDGTLVVRPKTGDSGVGGSKNILLHGAKQIIVQETCSIPGVVEFGNTWQSNRDLTAVDFSGLDVTCDEYFGYAFSGCRNLETATFGTHFDTGNVTNMNELFAVCEKLTSVDVGNFDMHNVKEIVWMFLGCSSLTSIDVDDWDTENFENIQQAFNGCSGLTSLNVSKWKTGNVTDMAGTFEDCSSLTSLNVSNWDTSKVTQMVYMFQNCSGLASLDVKNWDVSSCRSFTSMFESCSSLTSLDLSNWTTSKMMEAIKMFKDCSSLAELDISGFDTSTAWYMGGMFDGCTSLSRIKLGENFSFAGKGTDYYGNPTSEENKAILPTPTGDHLTGKWMLENTKNSAKTPEQLQQMEDVAGTWVWQYDYDIVFDANGGEGEMDTLTVGAGDDLTLTANAFTNENALSFLGWAKSADATEPEFTDKQEIEALSLTGNETITLYAIWEPIPAYAFTKGMDGVWTKESGVTLDFTVSRDPKNDTAFTHFTGIKIDGEAVDESSYTAVSGSVNLSLKADYLETLAEGSHTLTALFDDGSAETKFTVNPVSADEPADEPTDEPETPDEPAAPIEDPVTPDQPADSNNGDQDADADGNNGNSGNSSNGGKNYTQSGNSNKNSGSGKSNSPKTGDESNLVLWVAVLTVFGGAAATAVVFGQRKRKQ